MVLIAHRGLLEGPDKQLENKPDHITNIIRQTKFYAEIDLRMKDGELHLGHDFPQYKIDHYFLDQPKLVIHAKDLEALSYLASKKRYTNFFWHQDDDYVITSSKWIWAYPGKPFNDLCVNVLPELNMSRAEMKQLDCFGICSDYIGDFT